MEEFIGEFKAESAAILENLQSLLLSYEQSNTRLSIAEELFRGVHTLKGTSRMFGFDEIATATHQLENVLDEHRKLELPYASEFLDITAATLDYCQQVLDGIAGENKLATIVGTISSYNVRPQQLKQEPLKTYCIIFKPDADIFERGINPNATLDELNDVGTIEYFGTEANIRDLFNSRSVQTFDVWVASSKSQEAIEDVFLFFKTHEYKIISIQKESNISASLVEIQKATGIQLTESQSEVRYNFATTHLAAGSDSSSIPAANSEPDPKPSSSSAETNSKLNYINVPLAKLDRMMQQVSEFVILSGEVKYYASHLENEGLQAIAERLEKVTSSLRDNAFNMRLVPIQILSTKLQRYVKELGIALGKNVRLITEGMDTEIDKSIINQIEGPLMHIIRNAVDHGLELPDIRKTKGKPEEGILKLSAFYSGTNVFIHVQDDGAGIDLDKVRTKAISKGWVQEHQRLSEKEAIGLIFQPGFSTAEQTTEVSGRGVGMDVVRKNINDLRGSVEVTTEKDLGTSFAIRLPLALSILDVMIVKVGSLTYLVPNAEIDFCTSLSFTGQVEKKDGNIRFNNKLIPFIDMREFFQTEVAHASEASVIILNKNDQEVAIEVDEIQGREQVVIHPIDETLQIIPYLLGTSILGNGELAFLLDVIKLKELYARK